MAKYFLGSKSMYLLNPISHNYGHRCARPSLEALGGV